MNIAHTLKLTFVLIFFLTGCSKFGFMGVEDTEKAVTETQFKNSLSQQLLPAKLDVVPDEVSVPAGSCKGFTVNSRAQNGLISGPNMDLFFTVSSDNSGSFFEDAECKVTKNSFAISKGYSNKKFYFKSAPLKTPGSAETFRVVASTTYFSNNSATPTTYTAILGLVNSRPQIDNVDYSVNEDSTLSVQLRATDENGDALTFVKLTDPTHYVANGVLLSSTGKVTYTPTANFNGADSFQYYVTDGRTTSEVKTIRIGINPVNDAPVLFGLSTSTNEDVPMNIDLKSFVSDVDTDVFLNLAYTESLSFEVISGPTKGNHSLNGSIFSYSPNTNENGIDSFAFKVTDKAGASVSGTVQLMVNPVNDAPVANNGSLNTTEDTVADGNFVASDIDSSSLIYSIASNGSKGVVTILNASTGAFRYTPNLNQNGSDTFTFRAHDGGAFSNVATVTVNISPVNDAPVALNSAISLTEDIPKSAFFTSNDVDSSSLTYSIVSSGTRGTAVITNPSTGAFTYTPQLNATGADTITFTVSDGQLTSNLGTVAVTIVPANDPPVSQNSSISTTEDVVVNGTMVATDPEAGALTFSIYGQPNDGTVSILNASTGAFRYTPFPNSYGNDAFTFRAFDGTNYSNISTVSISVSPVNDPPVANDVTYEMLMNTSKAIELSITDVDSGAALSYAHQPPSVGTVVRSGKAITFTPPAGFTGTATLQFSVSDGEFTDSGVVTFNIGDGKPATVSNGPLCLGTSSSATITSSVLRTKVNGITGVDASIVYTIVTAPTRGYIRLGATTLEEGDLFTQADINANRILFVQTGGGNDFFEYIVDYVGDGGNQLGPLTFEVRTGAGCQ